ncbi:MAG TPA: AI-2E family transporter [Pyrinomonadaceae bacterium]|nr:AI-2E family transporter [Pyrinomonadaceae bacterium]
MSKQETKEAARAAAKAAVEAAGPPTRVILRVIFVILAVALVLWIIVKLTGVILLLVLSIFFAYLVSPLVEFLRRPMKLGKRTFSMPRVVAISLAYVVILLAIVGAIYIVVPRLGGQFPEFAEQARVYWRTLGEKAQNLNEYFRLHRMPGPVVNALNDAAHSLVGRISEAVSIMVQTIAGWLLFIPWLILIPILSFFLLKDVDSFRRSALQMLPRGRWRWRGDEFFQDVNSTLAAYVRAQLTACLFIAIICALGFTLLGLPGPLVMGFLAGVFEFIPLVGPLAVAIIAAVLAMLHGGLFSGLLVLVFLGVLRIVQDYFVYPRLIGQGIHLHPLAVILAILSGAELGGVTGIFLAIPVVAIVTVSYRHWLEHRGSEGLADLLESTPTNAEPLTAIAAPSDSLPRHPSAETTPDEMARVRPDLTTGELKLPVEE